MLYIHRCLKCHAMLGQTQGQTTFAKHCNRLTCRIGYPVCNPLLGWHIETLLSKCYAWYLHISCRLWKGSINIRTGLGLKQHFVQLYMLIVLSRPNWFVCSLSKLFSLVWITKTSHCKFKGMNGKLFINWEKQAIVTWRKITSCSGYFCLFWSVLCLLN